MLRLCSPHLRASVSISEIRIISLSVGGAVAHNAGHTVPQDIPRAWATPADAGQLLAEGRWLWGFVGDKDNPGTLYQTLGGVALWEIFISPTAVL